MANKKTHIEIWSFLIPCITLSALLILLEKLCIGNSLGRGTKIFSIIACFIPAICAFVLTRFFLNSLNDLHIFPNLRKNLGNYIAFMIVAMILALLTDPLISLIFPKAYYFDSFDIIVFWGGLMFLLSGLPITILTIMGEEIGWLSYMFPRLEKLYGTIPATVLMAVIRSIWHLPMLLIIEPESVFLSMCMLLVNNIFMDSLLVYSFKKTDSVVPAAMIHGITNTLSEIYVFFSVTNDLIYNQQSLWIQLVSLIPGVIIGIIYYIKLNKLASRQLHLAE